MSGYSSESNYKSKVKEKTSGFTHMIGVSFIGKNMSEIDAVSV